MATTDDEQQKPAATVYPPASGFSQSYSGYPPPGMAPPYQGYQYPPHPSYNIPGYANTANNYPFTAAPPAAYYSQSYLPVQPEPSTRQTFFRFIVTIMIVLLLGAFAMSILTWIIFGADIPSFYVQSLSVPYFNVSGDSLKAGWDANITVKNSNTKLDVMFQRLEGVIVYDDTILAVTDVYPFNVGKKQEATVNIKLSTTSPQQENFAENHQELVEDRKNGAVTFALRIMAATTFSSESMWRRQANVRVYCEDLQVRFAGPVGPGTLVGDKLKEENECLTYA